MSKKKKPEEANPVAELPMGLSMALLRNSAAMERYAALSDSQRASLVSATGACTSRREMQQLVQQLGEGKLPGGTHI